MDNFKIIYKILSALESAMDQDMFELDEISPEKLGISEPRWKAIIEMLVADGYIAGLFVTRAVNGNMIIQCQAPRITLKGLEYLDNNNMMKKTYRLLKGVKEVTPGI